VATAVLDVDGMRGAHRVEVGAREKKRRSAVFVSSYLNPRIQLPAGAFAARSRSADWIA
jgi:hypothetical protein